MCDVSDIIMQLPTREDVYSGASVDHITDLSCKALIKLFMDLRHVVKLKFKVEI